MVTSYLYKVPIKCILLKKQTMQNFSSFTDLASDDDVVFDVDDGDDGAVGVDFVAENSDVLVVDDAEVKRSRRRRTTQPGEVKTFC